MDNIVHTSVTQLIPVNNPQILMIFPQDQNSIWSAPANITSRKWLCYQFVRTVRPFSPALDYVLGYVYLYFVRHLWTNFKFSDDVFINLDPVYMRNIPFYPYAYLTRSSADTVLTSKPTRFSWLSWFLIYMHFPDDVIGNLPLDLKKSQWSSRINNSKHSLSHTDMKMDMLSYRTTRWSNNDK